MNEISTPFTQRDRDTHTHTHTHKHTLLPESREIIFHRHFTEYIQFWTEIYGFVSHTFILLVGPQNWVTNCAWVSTYNISETTTRSTNFWLLLLHFFIGGGGGGGGGVVGQYINWPWIESEWYCGAGRRIWTSWRQDHVDGCSTRPFHGKTHFATYAWISTDFSCVQKHTDEEILCLCATFEVLIAVVVKEQVLRDGIPCGLVTIYQPVLRNILEDLDLHCFMYYNEKQIIIIIIIIIINSVFCVHAHSTDLHVWCLW
jgi:hypothetical protein